MIEFLLHRTLPLDESVHRIIIHRLGELVVDLLEFLQKIDGFLNRLLDYLLHRLRFVELRFLLEISDRISLREDDLSIEFLVGARDYA